MRDMICKQCVRTNVKDMLNTFIEIIQLIIKMEWVWLISRDDEEEKRREH